MFTMLGGDGKEYGPVTVDQLRAWLTQGRANLDTKVKRLNDSVWMRVGDLPQFGGTASAIPPSVLSGASDATTPSSSESFAESVDPKLSADELISRAAKIDVFTCFEDGWELFKKNVWPFVGATVLFGGIYYGLGEIPGTAGLIVSSLLIGPVMGGYGYFFLGRARGKKTDLATFFLGFKKGFLPLMVATALTALFTVMGLAFFVFPGIYLLVAYTFTQLIILDKGLDFWPAMELSRRVVTAQWWRLLVMLILGLIVTVLGLIGLGVGVFFTGSITTAALVCAYEKLCNPTGASSAKPSLS